MVLHDSGKCRSAGILPTPMRPRRPRSRIPQVHLRSPTRRGMPGVGLRPTRIGCRWRRCRSLRPSLPRNGRSPSGAPSVRRNDALVVRANGRVGTSGRARGGLDGRANIPFGILGKLGVRILAGEQIHPAAVPRPVFPTARDRLAPIGQKHHVIARHGRRESFGFFIEPARLVRPGEQVGSPLVNHSEPRIAFHPAFLLGQADRAIAIQGQRGISGGWLRFARRARHRSGRGQPRARPNLTDGGQWIVFPSPISVRRWGGRQVRRCRGIG